MYKLTDISIEGFWGEKRIQTKLFDSVNIFIGQNGTGKTTLMNILSSVLSLDLKLLYYTSFSKIEMNLKRNKSKRKITIEKKEEDTQFFIIKYNIGTKTFEFPINLKDIDSINRRLHPKYSKIIQNCKEELDSLISVGWLSVHRDSNDNVDEFDDIFYRRTRPLKNPIDLRIENLSRRLMEYFLTIELEANKLSKQYQTDVLEALLYNSSFDIFSLESDSNIEPDSIKEGLIHAYKDLDALSSKMEKKIDRHANVIEKSLKNLKHAMKEKKPIELNDVFPIILLRRTNHVIELSNEFEKEKNNLMFPINEYLKLLSEFITDKKFTLVPGKKNIIEIKKKDNIIRIEDLSSGEKQLFILLTETLLQKNLKYIFIADEPELSLHIMWQKILVKSILRMNKNTQIIFATHSPEIAALWSKNIIKMENILV